MRDYEAMLRELERRRDMPCVWGSDANDCASYANAVVRAETARDILAELGLAWADEAAGRALLAARSMADRISAVLRPIPPAMAARGDLGLLSLPEGDSLVIVEGQLVSGPGPRRARLLPRHMLALAWSVE